MRETTCVLETKSGMIQAFKYLDKFTGLFKQYYSVNVPAVHNDKDILKYVECR